MLRRCTTLFLIPTLLLLLLLSAGVTCDHLEEQQADGPPTAAASTVLCRFNQSSALLRFKNSIKKILAPGRLSSWRGDGSDCCHHWEGVTCDNITGFVIALQIPYVIDSNCGIGSIDSSVFELQHLRHLDLSSNPFNGTIPKRFVELTHLTHLDLSGCHFSGQVPEELSQLTRLISLELSSNDDLQLQHPNFTALISRLLHLQHLRLGKVWVSMSGRDVSAALMSSPSLQKLQTLSLYSCNISGPLLDESLLHLQSLSYLNLGRNNLQSIPKFLDNLTSLYYLWLGGCGLQGKFPQTVFLLPKLEIISLSYNEELVVSLPPINVTRSTNIQFLYLSGIKELSHGLLVPSSPAEQPSLEVESNKMNGSGMSSCTSNMTSIRNLSSRNNPPGQIPQSLCSFPSLAILSLSGNSLNGTVPVCLFGRASLKTLVLSYNSLNIETIPACFSSLSSLMYLDLSYNRLPGSIPSSLFTLSSLEILDLSNSRFNGLLPQFHYPSSNLLTLHLQNNSLSGDIFSFMYRLPSLKEADLSSNYFTDTISLSHLLKLKNIFSLDLSNNRNLRVELPYSNNNTSMKPSQLQYLKLSFCDIQSFPKFICALGTIQHLDLSSNNMEGKIPSCLWSITGLSSLVLDHNKLDGFEEPTNATRARMSLFTASNNQINGLIPAFLCNSIAESAIVDMSNNALEGVMPDCLCKMSRRLNLSMNHLQGQIPNGFNINMSYLDLNGNLLIGTIPKSLSSCTTLEALDLGNNKLEDAFPGWLGQLTKLKLLVLRSNHLYGSISAFTSPQSFPALKFFDISSNHFSGTLPLELFEGLKAMMSKVSMDDKEDDGIFLTDFSIHTSNFSTSLTFYGEIEGTIKGKVRPITSTTWALNNIVDLSSNNFSGRIPEEIGMLKFLRGLNISSNHLEGPIPKSFGNLLQLEWLDLSRNQLSGVIPEELTSLTFLSILNLSYNDLQGRIPQEKQFNTFDPSSFEGNPMLCGPQVEKACFTREDGHNKTISKLRMEKWGWEYGLLGMEFAMGLLNIILPIVFVESVANWYWDQADKMIEFILMKILSSKFGIGSHKGVHICRCL